MFYLEDFADGQVYELGTHRITEEEIITFARAFDPQPFHVDPEAAARSVFGGLIASGWHTASLCMSKFVAGLVSRVVSMGSPGVDELRWLKPVRPGELLHFRVRVLEVHPSRSKPDRGSVLFGYEVQDGEGKAVLTMKSAGIIGRRPAVSK